MADEIRKPKQFRIRSDQVDWLAETYDESGLRSENQVMEFAIDHLIETGWRPQIRGDRGGWINGPSQDVP